MSRLSRTEWLDHALGRLGEEGFTVLKADVLVKSLGVSRGSFYWHFKNLADFHKAVLARWRELAVDQVVSQVEASGLAPQQKIRELIQVAISGDRRLEQAVRAWGGSNLEVKQIVLEVDRAAIAYIEQLFIEVGLNPKTALIRARIVYSGYLGQGLIREMIPAQDQEPLIEELLSMALG